MVLLRMRRIRPLGRVVARDLLEHHGLVTAGDQRTLRAVIGHLHPQHLGVETGQPNRVRCVDRGGEQAHARLLLVALAQVERVPGRVGHRDPARPDAEPGRAQLLRPLSRRLDAVDGQVEVELLWMLLPGPLRRHVVGRELERDPLTLFGPDRDPVTFLIQDLPAGELGIEGGQPLDVRRVEDHRVQLSDHVGDPAVGV
jgi:hypothetical protein